jgi:hypothetical protein
VDLKVRGQAFSEDGQVVVVQAARKDGKWV